MLFRSAVIDLLNQVSAMKIPGAVEEVRTAPVRHDRECDAEGMKETVRDILGLNVI